MFLHSVKKESDQGAVCDGVTELLQGMTVLLIDAGMLTDAFVGAMAAELSDEEKKALLKMRDIAQAEAFALESRTHHLQKDETLGSEGDAVEGLGNVIGHISLIGHLVSHIVCRFSSNNAARSDCGDALYLALKLKRKIDKLQQVYSGSVFWNPPPHGGGFGLGR